MDTQNLEKALQELLAKDNFKAAFEFLKLNLKSKAKLKSLASLERRYHNVRTELRNGTIASNEADLKMNRVHQSLVDLMDSSESTSSIDKKSFLSFRNLIIAGVLLLLLVFALGKANILNFGSPNSTNIIGDNNQVGDLTTSAERRFENALLLTSKEVMNNFGGLSLLIRSFQEDQPIALSTIDKRRPNETGAQFHDRVLNHHEDYRNYVREKMDEFAPVTQEYSNFKPNAAHNATIADLINRTYEKTSEIERHFASMLEKMRFIINTKKSDLELTERLTDVQKEYTHYAKIALAEAIAYFLQIPPDPVHLNFIKQNLNQAGISSRKHTAEEMHKELLVEIANLYQQKTAIIGESIKKPIAKGEQQEIQRLITDPYLIKFRQMAGLTDTLTEAEAWALKNKKIIDTITEPQKLLDQAAFAYLESDASTSATYLEKALKDTSLSPKIRRFIELSLERVSNPDIYEGSLGIMVVEVLPNSGFAKVGIKEGDVLFQLDSTVVNEPLDISMRYGKATSKDDLDFKLQRGEEVMTISLSGSQSLGAKITQLVLLNVVQI